MLDSKNININMLHPIIYPNNSLLFISILFYASIYIHYDWYLEQLRQFIIPMDKFIIDMAHNIDITTSAYIFSWFMNIMIIIPIINVDIFDRTSIRSALVFNYYDIVWHYLLFFIYLSSFSSESFSSELSSSLSSKLLSYYYMEPVSSDSSLSDSLS
jgi:hypothetical protein